MVKWILAITCWSVLLCCGSENPEGSKSYAASQDEPDQKADEIKDKKEFQQDGANKEPAGPPLPAVTPTPDKTAPTETFQLTDTLTETKWELSDLNGRWTASVNSVSSESVVLSVYESGSETFTDLVIPAKPKLPQDREYTYKALKTPSSMGSTYDIFFRFIPRSQECELIWTVDAWMPNYDEQVILHGHCEF